MVHRNWKTLYKIKSFPNVTNPAGNCMFKVNNRNTRKRCEICSNLTLKTPERFGSFIVNFEQVNAGWVTFISNTL